MKKKLPKEGVIITVGLLLFVSISLILNLISGHLFDAADTALSKSETSFGVEPEAGENTASLYEQGEQETGEGEAQKNARDLAFPAYVKNPRVSMAENNPALK